VEKSFDMRTTQMTAEISDQLHQIDPNRLQSSCSIEKIESVKEMLKTM
jgi:hypothetical protein